MRIGAQISPPSTWPVYHWTKAWAKDTGVRVDATQAAPSPARILAAPHSAMTKTTSGRIAPVTSLSATNQRQMTTTISDSRMLIAAIGNAAIAPMPTHAVAAALAMPQAMMVRVQCAVRDVSNSAIRKALAAQMKASPPSKRDMDRASEATAK